jgi:two-component sensor histidine kinase
MSIEALQNGAPSRPRLILRRVRGRTAASYERELSRLRQALARETALRRERDRLIQLREVLSKESDHRLLNGLQMVASLLSLQSRASASGEVASRIADAAQRVANIKTVQRHLHRFDGEAAIALNGYLKDLCHDFSTMLSWEERPDHGIVVEGVEIALPAVTAIPLGFIVNELIMNAAKYGNGRIRVKLEKTPLKGYALSVLNDGASLPDSFDPAASKGLGMKIIHSLVGQIGGELQFGLDDQNQGTRFTVSFS